MSRAAHELGSRADELRAELEQCLRRELPALWEDPDVARMASDNVAEHLVAALFGIEHAIDPELIEPPAADVERARGLARHGTPLSTMLRAFRLAQGLVIDRLIVELPRLSDDPEQVSAAARELITVSTTYVDRVSEQGVVAFQEERDRRLRWRSAMVNEAGMRIGTTLDIARTAQELADLATEHFADLVTVDLLDAVLRGEDCAGEGPHVLRRMAWGAGVGGGPAPKAEDEPDAPAGVGRTPKSGPGSPAGVSSVPEASVEAGAAPEAGPVSRASAGAGSVPEALVEGGAVSEAGPVWRASAGAGSVPEASVEGGAVSEAGPVWRASAGAGSVPQASVEAGAVPEAGLGRETSAGAGPAPQAVGGPEAPAGVWSDTAIALQQLHTCPHGSPSAYALATGRPSRHQYGGAAPDAGSNSTLVVPLRARGTTLGVAVFHRYGRPARYDEEDLLLAQEIAARAAVAVDNACRYTQARATALTLQRSLLPRHAPRQSAVDVAYRYLPAGSDAGVGGDWYDVIPLSGARVALVVGDVVGHGIRAAATMGRLRTAVRTLADIDLPPDELLTHLDDVVLRLSAEASTGADSDSDSDGDGDAGPEPDPHSDAETGGDLGATCLYAVYDPVSRRCTLARAGHVPPAVVIRDGTVDILELPPGPPLGLGGLPFETVEVELPEGSLIALYTDGLIEARSHDVDAGLTTLRQALSHPAPSLDAACDHVLEALLPSSGLRPDDDIALLLARTRVLGADRVATWHLDADPEVVARARSDVARQLADWGLAELDFTAELVVSELLTNAIRYGRPPISLRLIHDRTLLCEVSDASSTTPHLRRARVFDEGGRGLLLVAQLATQWGTRHARRGKTVWAELNESAAFPVPVLE
ncbi:phosphatase [Streptomyces caeruleatus]|uniref:Phosphatase n=1 Tax=Streptomyces caeruleatus TaxID=661399 RepID=A0A101U3X6_9ACTN|nr:phosphatase [Streptomyces caeruleatus]